MVAVGRGCRVDVLVADNPQMRDRLWETRKLIIEALQNLSPQHIMDTQDIVVPRTQLPQLLPRIKEIGERYQLPVISFGHAGDGNVHVNIIKDVAKVFCSCLLVNSNFVLRHFADLAKPTGIRKFILDLYSG